MWHVTDDSPPSYTLNYINSQHLYRNLLRYNFFFYSLTYGLTGVFLTVKFSSRLQAVTKIPKEIIQESEPMQVNGTNIFEKKQTLNLYHKKWKELGT